MTHIITIAGEKAFFLASDSRLHYFKDVTQLGEKYKLITAIADCIQKTFYIKKAKIGIQFLGIGYFQSSDSENYPISHFIPLVNQLDFKYRNFTKKCTLVYDFLKKLSEERNTGQYMKGVMAGFNNHKKHICTFNTYNNSFEIKEILNGQYINSENTKLSIDATHIDENRVLGQIRINILESGARKPHSIGGPIDILKVTEYSAKFIQKNTNLFSGNQSELISAFNSDVSLINGRILRSPIMEKYSL